MEIPIILIKEFVYCPRIAYFKYYSVWEPPTESMKFPRYTKTWLARLLRSYGVEGEIIMEHPVKSRKLGIHGRVDAVVVNGRKAHVVEVKLSTSKKRLQRKARHHLMQLMAYVVATEETLRKTIDKAYIAILEREELIEITPRPTLRQELVRIVNEFRTYIEQQRLPPKTPAKARCKNCFYRKACP